MDQVDPYCFVKDLRIKLIRINLTDQLDPYNLWITLTHTHQKCEKSVETVLIFKKKCWVHLATPSLFLVNMYQSTFGPQASAGQLVCRAFK